MPDLFYDFGPKDLAKIARGFLESSRKKLPKHFQPSDKMAEGYQYLSGEISDTSKLHYHTYCNELYDAWKGWAPKFCSRPPRFMVRPGDTASKHLADTCEELFAHKTNRFDYQQMILQCCQDAVILGVGYARHQFDEHQGLTVTERIKPQHVFWQAGAKTIRSAQHVIEKRTLPRWQFVKKFGAEVGWEVPPAEEEDDVDPFWPEDDGWLHKGKGPLETIEYYLLWSRHGDHRRVYAFHEHWDEDYLQPICRKKNKACGEEWGFDFDDGEWHITPLIPTVLNDRIEGIAVWEVVRGQYLTYQNLLGASIKFALETCKNPILTPEGLVNMMKQVEASGATTFSVKYDPAILAEHGVRSISDLVHVLDLGEVNADLLREVQYHQARFQQLMGVNAIAQIQPGGVETAAEATKLADAAANRVADDQGAVERWTVKCARKELQSDLKRIPKLTVGKWTMEEDHGEAPTEWGKMDENEGVNWVKQIPHADAIKLEKGPASDKAALRMEAAREEKRNQAFAERLIGGPQAAPPEQAEQEVPVTPEVEVRQRYGVPVLATFEITNPGIEQFVPAENAVHWPERSMTRREVEQMFSVAVEPGTSSSTGRMQRVQEIGMVAKTNMPTYQELQLDKQTAGILNAVVKSLEMDSLEDCEVTPEEIAEARQRIQQAAAEAAQAEAQAKMPQGESPEVVKMQSDAEMAKAEASVITSKEKTVQIDKKNEGDAARNRMKNESQLLQARTQQAMMNGAPV